MKRDLQDLNLCLAIRKCSKKQGFCLGWLLLSGSEVNSLIGHLNNFLGGREEWSPATLIIGKKKKGSGYSYEPD